MAIIKLGGFEVATARDAAGVGYVAAIIVIEHHCLMDGNAEVIVNTHRRGYSKAECAGMAAHLNSLSSMPGLGDGAAKLAGWS